MADGLVSMADQFKGLPMSDLIGGPLQAACDANVLMAQATADFIKNVGFNVVGTKDVPDPKDNSKTIKIPETEARMVKFEFSRPNVDEKGDYVQEDVTMNVPMLAITPIPCLHVESVDVTFDMEVKSSTSEKSSKDSEAELSGSASVGWGPFSVRVNIHGKTSSHQENTRTSDNSAKYHVEVHAVNADIPEGLARVLDIMATAAAPSQIKAQKITKDGELHNDDKPLLVNEKIVAKDTDLSTIT